ncbi:MAG: AmpG family muropeptide MFS transporter [Deltaproteobacteria bacterium]|nr:AmpG family muropeptide MFS transporter [Deltaproteobacteria bacterium]MBV8452365.1 AmpG family muropeptide MFS transporter [Deltaproteobacteria bacterium]
MQVGEKFFAVDDEAAVEHTATTAQKGGGAGVAGCTPPPLARRHGGWRRSFTAYSEPRVLLTLPLGFASGLPLLLTFSTLSVRLATAGVSRAAIGAFALVGTPYAFKFVWSPLIDRLPPPLPLGHRRGWGVTIQIALIAAVLALGHCNPKSNLAVMGALALLVAFLSASQDIVIDAWRVETLNDEQQGPGAGMIQTGYRIGMLISGAGALIIAARAGWFVSYAIMAGLLTIGMLAFMLGPEPAPAIDRRLSAKTSAPKTLPPGRGEAWRGSPAYDSRNESQAGLRQWLATAVIGPFEDFMQRPYWPAILLFVLGYKLGEAMAGMMAMPLYVALGYTLNEIAAVSKLVGFFATLAGALAGGLVTARVGVLRALIFCGILQSAGNLFYVLQVIGGHRLDYLALCVAAENMTGAMAGAALVAYLSSLCSPAFTATQYALLSSLAAVGRTLVASAAGVLAERMGWKLFFLSTTVATLPALLLLVWIARKSGSRLFTRSQNPA